MKLRHAGVAALGGALLLAGAAAAEEASAGFRLAPHRATYAGELLDDRGGRYELRVIDELSELCDEWRWESEAAYLPLNAAADFPRREIHRAREPKDGSRFVFEDVLKEIVPPPLVPFYQSSGGEVRRGESFAFADERVFISEEVLFPLEAARVALEEAARSGGGAQPERAAFLAPLPHDATGMISSSALRYAPAEITAREAAEFGEILGERRIWSFFWRIGEIPDGAQRGTVRGRVTEDGVVLEETSKGLGGLQSLRLVELELRAPEACLQASASP